MKKVFYLLTLFLTLTSCSQDINILPVWPLLQPNNSNGQYAIGGYINGQQTTRSITRAVIDESYGNKFSLFVWTKDSIIMNNYHGVFNNNIWGYTENVKYFDNFVQKYNFIGLIPEGGIINDGIVTTQAESFTTDTVGNDNRELLFATTTVEKDNYAYGATLNFYHINSKIQIGFTSDDANTEILDYSPSVPEVPASPGITTQETKTTRFFDELIAGNSCGWPVATSGETANNGWHGQAQYVTPSNDLGNLMDVVNSQFIYYDENNQITDHNWVPAENRKNKIFIKFADNVNVTEFINGNDAFMKNASADLKSIFQANYTEGWRVIRINKLSNGSYSAWLTSNIQRTVTYYTTTGATEYQPAVEGIKGIIVLPAKVTNSPNRTLDSYVSTATANISLNGCEFTATNTSNNIIFTVPTSKISTTATMSPTYFYSLPCNDPEIGYTIKFSFKYKGVNVYDARVWVPSTDVQWEQGKYYKYIINIKGRGNGNVSPNNKVNDPTIPVINNYQINVSAIIYDYVTGNEYSYDIQ